MSMNDSLVVAATAVKDSVFTVADASAVQDVAQAVSQGAVTAVTDVLGKGGFSVQPTFGQVVEFQLTGLMVVFTVLGGLTLMCYLLAWMLKTVAPDQFHGKSKPAPAAPAAPKQAAVALAPAVTAGAAPVVTGIHPGLSDEELVAILAVAASEGMGRPVSLVKFRPQDSMDWTWSVQGRVGLHSSHKL
jgi:hypothetical protein